MFVRMGEGIENASLTNISIHRDDDTFLRIEHAHIPSEKVKSMNMEVVLICGKFSCSASDERRRIGL